MAFLEDILIAVVILLIAFIFLYTRARSRNQELIMQLGELISKKQSLSAKYGRMSEQFMPFLKTYPYNPEGFRFIGSPIDGVQFEKDKIIFIEFKAGGHPLSTNQKTVKELVEKGKVEFREVRIRD